MPCFHPRELVVNKRKVVYKWTLNRYGKAVIEKDLKGRPIVLGVLDKYVIQVPCGKCPACLAMAQSQWSFRIEQEALYGGYPSVLFVTYTYAPEFLPVDLSVHKEEVKRYIHDLRQKLERRALQEDTEASKVRYYFCAEYGSKFGRPHYHAILFFTRSVDWSIIQSAWGKGIVDIREFTPARAGYVAKYTVKDINLDYAGRLRPFHLQSMGLGKCFLLSHPTFASLNYQTWFSNSSGHKVKLPRYYIDKLGTTRKYYLAKDIAGNEVKKSSSFHSFAYDYTNTLSYLRYNQKRKIDISSSGLSEIEYDRLQYQKQFALEQNLINLSYKSYYYVASKFEQRTVSA